MTFDWIAVLRDVLIIGYLFVLRIGVPLVIVMLGGMWLRKVLEPKAGTERAEAPRPVAPPSAEAPRL